MEGLATVVPSGETERLSDRCLGKSKIAELGIWANNGIAPLITQFDYKKEVRVICCHPDSEQTDRLLATKIESSCHFDSL
jgi:hypothetical protein